MARVRDAPRAARTPAWPLAPPQRLEMPEIGDLGSKSKAILMHPTSPAVLLLLSLSCAMLAAPAVCDTGVGPPPALVPGQAPPLSQAGRLAKPRSSDQVGFPRL